MHLQILENVTIYQINKSLSKLAWISRFPAISYLYIIFGSLGVLTNLLWMVKLWYVKKKKRVHYYYICYAVASVMTSATFILEYGRLLAYESSKSLVTPCYCIIYAVHPTLFAVLPITIAEIVFFMSWDVYVTISSTKCHGRKISRQQVVVIIAVYTFSIITMVSAAWWSAAYKKSQAISVVCMLTDVVTKGFLITLAVFTSVFSWGSLIFLICSTLSMKRHNPVSPGLQAILLRRKSKLVKNLFIIGIFTCLAQNLPFTVGLIAMIKKKRSHMLALSWISQIISLPLHALFRLFEKNCCFRKKNMLLNTISLEQNANCTTTLNC
ncbi:hypothetical protein T4E_9705 [Trichinella pseudospiralis]|uniref:G-protein coupled receptors family 1 profile domain-containing protein n=1 Tax=Trichinella pseudospiralis TaxID=6337 RepID=A0A0V0XL51_TRIPS|nr:hypothetical protein T4E_9705 [Trichinella pseudospiralis]